MWQGRDHLAMVVVERDFFAERVTSEKLERDGWNDEVLENDELSRAGRGLDWKLKIEGY